MFAPRVTFTLLLIVSFLGTTTIAQASLRDDNQETPIAEKLQDENKKSDEKNAAPKKSDQKHRDKNKEGNRKGKESEDKKDHSAKSSNKNRDEKKGNDKQKPDAKKSEKKQAADPQDKKSDAPPKEMKRAAKQAPIQKEELPKEESPKEESKPERPATKADEPQADQPEQRKDKKNSDGASLEREQGEPTPATRPIEEGAPAEAPAARQRESKSALAPKPDTQKPPAKPAEKQEAKKIDRKKFAISDLAQVDDDFWLQGEYHGMLRRPDGVLESAGIQVVARGEGKFIGRQLRGGLPGNGWDNVQTIELAGQREGTRLVLRHEQGFQVSIENNQATVSNSSGNVLGILMKVQRRSKMIGLQPTGRAIVLFDGNATDHFVNAKVDENGLLQIGTVTKEPVQDFRLHLEFRLPYMPYATGQARSNSGVYIQERYEVQILDSFGLPGEFNDCGSLYRTKPPEVNMCFPPLVWQSYDIYFTAARFDDGGNKISPARISVLHNGILVQDNYLLPNKTGAGKAEGPEPRPIKLQDHGNPVVFRNVWIERPEVAAEPAPVGSEIVDDSVELIPAGEPLPRP